MPRLRLPAPVLFATPAVLAGRAVNLRRAVIVGGLLALLVLMMPARAAAAPCSPAPGNGFFGLPTWYQYMPGQTDPESGKCRPDLGGDDGKVDMLSFLPVLLALVEILLRISGLAAVAYVIYGGVKYITSQGNPDGTTKARQTIINALIGLVVAIISITLVAFIGRTFI